MQCLGCQCQTNNPKFCSRSCAARYNNTNDHWRTKKGQGPVVSTCPNCNEEYKRLRSSPKKYCSFHCSVEHKKKMSIEEWKFGTRKAGRFVKRYLIERSGYRCSVCNNSVWNGQPITLEVEHIDGNPYNNNEDNLCLLCPNCHSQTSTYKGRNKGRGRHERRTRYHAGLSY